MTNIYKYTFYLSYKLGKRIKTPEPEFAAACMASLVMLSQLIIILAFLDALKLLDGFLSLAWVKPLTIAIGFIILYVNYKYTFGLKELRYLNLIADYDKNKLVNKVINVFFTVFVILIIPIICGVLLWDSRNNNAYIQRLLLNL